MRLVVLAVGRLGRGPETALVGDYIERTTAVGRAIGLGPAEVVEVEPRRSGKPAEAAALLEALHAQGPGSARVVACDEHGAAEPSRAFATRLGGWRDEGVRRAVFLIGGADGLDPAVLDRADRRLGFGPQTWPHALARVMLAEQLYRAATLLAGGPYHRD